MQCACVVLSSVSWPSLHFFHIFSQKARFSKKIYRTQNVYNFPYNFFFQNISHSNKNSARHYHKCTQVLCKVSVIRVRYPKKKKKKKKRNLNFFDIFSKNPHISQAIKIRPLGAELLHADGRTDRHDEPNSRFLQFCERA